MGALADSVTRKAMSSERSRSLIHTHPFAPAGCRYAILAEDDQPGPSAPHEETRTHA